MTVFWGPDVVDPGLSTREVRGRNRLAQSLLGGDHSEALQLVRLVREPPDHTPRVRDEDGVAHVRLKLLDDIVAPEHIRLPVGVDLGCRKHDGHGLGCRVDGIEERVVLVLVAARLRELDVVGDHLRTRRDERVDHVRVQRSRERPLHTECVECRVVDRDDGDVVRWPLRSANREARVDRVELVAAEDVAKVGGESEGGRHQPDAEEERRVYPPSLPCPHPESPPRSLRGCAEGGTRFSRIFNECHTTGSHRVPRLRASTREGVNA